MQEVKKIVDSANKLVDELMEERNRLEGQSKKLDEQLAKCDAREEACASREAAVLNREQAENNKDSANKILSAAESVRKGNAALQKEMDDRIAECNRVQKETKEAVDQLERDKFDFAASKKAHSNTRSQFNKEKEEFEAKVAEFKGINV